MKQSRVVIALSLGALGGCVGALPLPVRLDPVQT
jgi:hypothetical protein